MYSLQGQPAISQWSSMKKGGDFLLRGPTIFSFSNSIFPPPPPRSDVGLVHILL